MPTFTLTPLGEALGAEITGIDIAETDAAGLEALKAAAFEHAVLCIRGQKSLTPEQQIAFTRNLGELHQHVLSHLALEGYPEILVASNETDENGKPIGIKDAGQYWHTDISYEKRPLSFSLLRAIKLPEKDGKILGDTQFASTWRAYEALPDAMKRRLADLKAVHSYTTYTEARKGRIKIRGETKQDQKARVPDNIHPVVRTHPENGRQCLYVNEGFTIQICGMAEDESKDLLAELFAHIKRPEFLYRHRWQPDDLVIWDNVQTQHCAVNDYDVPRLRTMHRTSVVGSVPF
ncbi:MAG: TauD/TfdA family dioxygenase [Rhodospirillales bacterium]